MRLGISLDVEELHEGMILIESNSKIEHVQIHYDANTKLQDYEWFIKRIKESYEYISFSIHAYNEINFAELNNDVLMAWRNVARRTIDEAATIEGVFVNFHFGIYCEGIDTRERSRAKVITEFIELQNYASTYQLEVHIENIYSSPPMSEYQFLGDQLVDFNALCHQNSDINICYDFGHGNISGFAKDFLATYMYRIKSMHIHDNNGIIDLHQPVGEGNTDWKELFSQLRSSTYDYYLILEHYVSHYSNSIKYLKEYDVI